MGMRRKIVNLSGALGLHGKVLVGGGAAGVASVRRCQKLPPCSVDPVPASSKKDPSVAKAEPISDAASISLITYLRRGNKLLCNISWERSENR